MKVAKYLIDNSNGFYETQKFFKDDKDFKETFMSHTDVKTFWRLKHTEIETDHYIKPEFSNFFESNDVEEVIYSEQYKNIPVTKLKYQYEWRYQKSMLWFITPEKFESDEEFKTYISKAVVLDLIDFRRFVKPAHKEIGI